MPSRTETTCPGIRICCPTCGGTVHGAEIPDGEGFFLCQRHVPGPDGLVKCRQHFYVHCTAYLCTAIAITSEEREAMRVIDGPAARLAWLGLRVARAA